MQAYHELYELNSCAVQKGCPDHEMNIIHNHRPLTLIQSFAIVDGKLQKDRTKICRYVL